MREEEFSAERGTNQILITYGVTSEVARQQLFG
jgi:hypothetical protein